MSDIEKTAAAWAVRADAQALGPKARAELEAWLADDPRHRGAFLRAQAGLRLIDQASVVKDVLPAPERSVDRKAYVGRALVVAATLAACALLLLVAPLGDLQTQVGEQRRVALEDGSVAMINTDSRVGVKFDPDLRHVRLKRGEAWFQVAKHPERPFVVEAGDVRVRATGTAFSVRRDPQGVRVVVTEGRVLVWREGQGAKPVAVVADQEAFVPVAEDAGAAKVQASRAEDVLAWRRGEIVLNGHTLAAAAAEFNRYNQQKIIVRGERAGQATMVGYFLIDQPSAFAMAAARTTGSSLREVGGDLVIENSQ